MSKKSSRRLVPSRYDVTLTRMRFYPTAVEYRLPKASQDAVLNCTYIELEDLK